MSLPSNITNKNDGTNAVILGTNYDQTINAVNSATWSDRAREMDVPKTLQISHELASGGQRRNSVIILKSLEKDGDDPTRIGVNQVMLKVTTDLLCVEKASTAKLMQELCALVLASVPLSGSFDKTALDVALMGGTDRAVTTFDISAFLNGEH